MPFSLYNLSYIQLNDSTWCMSAQIASTHHDGQDNTHSAFNYERQQQRKGVRDLLQHLLQKLAIYDDLDETQFPYRLIHHRYYVCFSHSVDRVAVVVSSHRPVGIDIEVQSVKWSIVQRYYHTDELAVLDKLNTIKRAHLSRLLWQVKECFIKVHNYTLAQGMGINYAQLIDELLINTDNEDITPIRIKDTQSIYRIVLLPKLRIIITL